MKTRASLVLVGLVVSVAGIIIFSMQAYGQESYNIPSWIKNNAKWWADGQIGDSDFVKGIQYLIDNNILHVSTSSQNSPNNGISNNVGLGIPRVYTDKHTYSVGDTIKISGSGFDKGAVGIVIEDESYINFVNNYIGDDMSQGEIPGLKDIMWDNFVSRNNSYGTDFPWTAETTPGLRIDSAVDADLLGSWQTSINHYQKERCYFDVTSPQRQQCDYDKNNKIIIDTNSLSKGNYEIWVSQATYNPDVRDGSSSRTLLIKDARVVFKID